MSRRGYDTTPPPESRVRADRTASRESGKQFQKIPSWTVTTAAQGGGPRVRRCAGQWYRSAGGEERAGHAKWLRYSDPNTTA